MKYETKEGPDRGWSWIVAIAACFSSIAIAGIYRIQGLQLVAFMNEFNVPREAASWPLFLGIAVFRLSGIVAGPLAYRYGVRPISILGSIVGAVAVACCFCVTSLTTITLFFGVIFGIGCGVVYTLVPIIVNQYFLKRRAIAMGIALSGVSFGTLIFPSLHEHLISNYGLNGYFLLLGGIVLQTVISGALMPHPPWLKKTKNVTKQRKIKSSDASGYFNNGKNTFHKVSNYDNRANIESYSRKCKGKKDSHTTEWVNVNESSDKNKTIPCSKDALNQVMNVKIDSEPYTNVEETLYQDSNPVMETKYLPQEEEKQILDIFQVDGKEIFDRIQGIQCNICCVNLPPGSSETSPIISILANKTVHTGSPEDHCSTNLTRKKLDNRICKNLFNTTANRAIKTTEGDEQINSHSEHDNNTNHQKPEVKISNSLSHFQVINYLAENDDPLRNKQIGTDGTSTATHKDIGAPLSILQAFKVILMSPMFHLTCIGNTGFYSILFLYMVIIVDFAMDRGVAEGDTKYILFAFAIADLIGRLGFGWITDNNHIRRPHYVMICMMATAILLFIYPFVYSLTMHLCFSSIYGLLSGCTVVVYPVLLADYVGKEVQDIGIGFMTFLNGVVMLFWPFVIGYFRDNLGSYSIMFYISGATALCTCLLWLFEKCFSKEQRAILK